MDTKKPEDDSDRQIDIAFVVLVIAIAVAGTVVALVAATQAGEPTTRWDAWREIGGALVSGAVLAGVVVWYEERVDRRRAKREEDRDEAAAVAAWTRDIDLQMLKIVRHSLAVERRKFLLKVSNHQKNLEGILETTPQTSTSVGPPHGIGQEMAQITELTNEAIALARMQAQPALRKLLQAWLHVAIQIPLAKVKGHEEISDRLEHLKPLVTQENALWGGLEKAFRAHQEDRYPTSALENSWLLALGHKAADSSA